MSPSSTIPKHRRHMFLESKYPQQANGNSTDHDNSTTRWKERLRQSCLQRARQQRQNRMKQRRGMPNPIDDKTLLRSHTKEVIAAEVRQIIMRSDNDNENNVPTNNNATNEEENAFCCQTNQDMQHGDDPDHGVIDSSRMDVDDCFQWLEETLPVEDIEDLLNDMEQEWLLQDDDEEEEDLFVEDYLEAERRLIEEQVADFEQFEDCSSQVVE